MVSLVNVVLEEVHDFSRVAVQTGSWCVLGPSPQVCVCVCVGGGGRLGTRLISAKYFIWLHSIALP